MEAEFLYPSTNISYQRNFRIMSLMWQKTGMAYISFPTCPVYHNPPSTLSKPNPEFMNILLTYLLTYLLTPWCRVLLEKLTGLQLVKKFPAFHGTQRFITALTSVRHLSLSWVSPTQSIYPYPTSWRSILILSTHLRLGLPSGLLPSGFPNKTIHTPSFWIYYICQTT